MEENSFVLKLPSCWKLQLAEDRIICGFWWNYLLKLHVICFSLGWTECILSVQCFKQVKDGTLLKIMK